MGETSRRGSNHLSIISTMRVSPPPQVRFFLRIFSFSPIVVWSELSLNDHQNKNRREVGLDSYDFKKAGLQGQRFWDTEESVYLKKGGSLMRKFLFILGALTLSLIMAGVAAADTIDTTPDWNGSAVQPFGYQNTATYGEVVTAPGGALQSFTFYMNQPAFTFEGYVYAWNGSKATGAALWSSGPMSTAGSGGFEPITFSTGGINLTTGSQYVLFASISNYYTDGDGTGQWGYIGQTGNYPSTYFTFYNNGGDFSALTTNAWEGWGAGQALAFKAEFSSVPLPGAVWLLGSGLLGLAGLGRRKFSKS
jgi:hypothetical protein